MITSSGSEHNSTSRSSDEDGGNLKEGLCNHTLHEVRSLSGKTPAFTASQPPESSLHDSLKWFVWVEPSVSYGVDTGDAENGSEDDESEAIYIGGAV